MAVLVFTPFALSLDVRTHHSETLLPLCVAAYVNSQSSKVRSGRSTLNVIFAVSDAETSTWDCAIGSGTGQLGSEGAHLDAGEENLDVRLNNVAAFLRGMGVGATFENFAADHLCSFRRDMSSLCIAIFVLRTTDAAVLWLCDHATEFPLSNTILLVGPAIVDDVHACTACRAAVKNMYHACGGGAQPRMNPHVLRLRDYIYLDVKLLLRGPGPEGCGAYAGFAPALLDSIGAKFGAAFLTALKRKRGTGRSPSVKRGPSS
jgi:hypothetical protein